MPNIYSGVCLAALFNAIFQEHRRLRGEAVKIRTTVEALAQPSRPPVRPGPALSGLAAGRS